MAKNYKKMYYELLKEYEEMAHRFGSYLCHMTNSRMSYTNYHLHDMITVSDDYQQEHHMDWIKDDIAEIINGEGSSQEKVGEIREYFEIDFKSAEDDI